MSRFLQTTLLLLAIVFITAGCIGKTTPQSDDNKSGGSEQTTVNANSTQVPVGDLAKWQTLTRESEGFSMKLPQGWWWQRDSDLQAELDAGFAVGFAWNQGERDAQNYAVIFFIANENELAGFDGYQKVATTQNDKQYVFRGAAQYRDIINAMAESFELLNEEINVSDWKTYRNEDLRVEFQYPKNFPPATLEKKKGYAGGAFPGDADSLWRLYVGQKVQFACYTAGANHPFYFEEYPIMNKERWMKELRTNDSSMGATEYQESIINDATVIWYNEGPGEGAECAGRQAMIFGENKVVRFAYVINTIDAKSEITSRSEIFDKILSTFKFID